MERFFQFFMRDYEFGYTLFGQKPLSIACVSNQLVESIEYLTFAKGWEAWSRLQHLFPSDHFVLKKDKCGECKENELFFISLINRATALKTISSNLPLFQEVWGEHSPEDILETICHEERSIFDIKPPPQAAIGTLLGYGKGNALNFQKEITKFHQLSHKITPPLSEKKTVTSLSPFGQHCLKIFGTLDLPLKKEDSSVSSLLDEVKEVFDARQTFNLPGDTFMLEKYTAPAFACWENNPETDALRNSYSETRAVLRNAYKNGDFLEITLKQWTDPR